VPRIRFIAQSNLPTNKIHGALQAGHPLFQIANIVGNLIDPAPYMPEVFKNQIFYIFVHGLLPCQMLKYINYRSRAPAWGCSLYRSCGSIPTLERRRRHSHAERGNDQMITAKPQHTAEPSMVPPYGLIPNLSTPYQKLL